MPSKYLTTTQAARLLSVSPDTVLKWVRAGKIASYRTPGGHCRIPPEAVQELLPHRRETHTVATKPSSGTAFQYCWEFNNGNGSCSNCLVFQTRAMRCYELRSQTEESIPQRLNCTTSCAECGYFSEVQGQGISVLIVTRSTALERRLTKENTGNDFNIAFAGSSYEAATVVESFRPDYVVVDCSLGSQRTKDLCKNLTNDPRLPVTRLILASAEKAAPDICGLEVLGWLHKPFSVGQLRQFLRDLRFPARPQTQITSESSSLLKHL